MPENRRSIGLQVGADLLEVIRDGGIAVFFGVTLKPLRAIHGIRKDGTVVRRNVAAKLVLIDPGGVEHQKPGVFCCGVAAADGLKELYLIVLIAMIKLVAEDLNHGVSARV